MTNDPNKLPAWGSQTELELNCKINLLLRKQGEAQRVGDSLRFQQCQQELDRLFTILRRVMAGWPPE